jgi:hypothetical protein
VNTVRRNALMGAHDHRSELSHRTTAAGRHKAPLVGALTLTGGFLVVEVVGALWTGSLALLADAGHMLTDIGGLSLSLLAIYFAQRPPTPANTYGNLRTEILTAHHDGDERQDEEAKRGPFAGDVTLLKPMPHFPGGCDVKAAPP